MHAVWPSVPAFPSLLERVDSGQTGRHERCTVTAADTCKSRFNSTLGDPWLACVVQELQDQKERAEQARSLEYFPVEPDTLQQLRPGGRGSWQTDELKNLLRNYSCEVADGGSQPLRSFEWTYRPADPCLNATAKPRFVYANGFLPAGHDLHSARMGETEAQEWCDASDECFGFTFSAPESERAGTGSRHHMLFKSSAEGQSTAAGWHTYRKVRQLDCSADSRARRSAPMTLSVHVLRESPPVFIVDDFVSDAECEHMMSETVPVMGRSVVGGGGTSNWRRSYSVNMVPDFDNEDNVVTRIARRKFAFAREVARYPVEEGVGQEPINAVYYKDDGDQYRPHCDGECAGGRYQLGSRVASSLAYCSIADRGGYTLFTRTHLKVVPKKRQLLFFGYFFGEAEVGVQMDNGWTEHTGCPLRTGRKWIATMWYREGVTPEKTWEYWSHQPQARHGV